MLKSGSSAHYEKCYVMRIPLSTIEIAWCLCGIVDEVMRNDDTSNILITSLSEIEQYKLVHTILLTS